MMKKQDLKDEIDACMENVREELSNHEKDWNKDWHRILANVQFIVEGQSIYYAG